MISAVPSRAHEWSGTQMQLSVSLEAKMSNPFKRHSSPSRSPYSLRMDTVMWATPETGENPQWFMYLGPAITQDSYSFSPRIGFVGNWDEQDMFLMSGWLDLYPTDEISLFLESDIYVNGNDTVYYGLYEFSYLLWESSIPAMNKVQLDDFSVGLTVEQIDEDLWIGPKASITKGPFSFAVKYFGGKDSGIRFCLNFRI